MFSFWVHALSADALFNLQKFHVSLCAFCYCCLASSSWSESCCDFHPFTLVSHGPERGLSLACEKNVCSAAAGWSIQSTVIRGDQWMVPFNLTMSLLASSVPGLWVNKNREALQSQYSCCGALINFSLQFCCCLNVLSKTHVDLELPHNIKSWDF